MNKSSELTPAQEQILFAISRLEKLIGAAQVIVSDMRESDLESSDRAHAYWRVGWLHREIGRVVADLGGGVPDQVGPRYERLMSDS